MGEKITSKFLNFLQYCYIHIDAMQRVKCWRKERQESWKLQILGRGLRTVVSSKPTQTKLLQGCRYLTLHQMLTFCTFWITSFSINPRSIIENGQVWTGFAAVKPAYCKNSSGWYPFCTPSVISPFRSLWLRQAQALPPVFKMTHSWVNLQSLAVSHKAMGCFLRHLAISSFLTFCNFASILAIQLYLLQNMPTSADLTGQRSSIKIRWIFPAPSSKLHRLAPSAGFHFSRAKKGLRSSILFWQLFKIILLHISK